MHKPMPPLNALRTFEAAARHLSLTKAAQELHVTAGALSHQIRGLEELLGLKLFERRVRSIALTPAGKQLYPGLQTGFIHIRDAVVGLSDASDARVLVISTPPGFTSKWLAPRLYRFSNAYPEIDARVSSSLSNANFTTDGVDVAVRNLPVDAAADPELVIENLVELSFVPVCSPKLIETYGPFTVPEALKGVPLIHDDTLANRAAMPTWADWFKAAGVDGVDVSRGLRFNSADHALDATVEGAGVLLAHDVLAYDELRTGRLAIPFGLTLRSGRAYHFVCAKRRQDHPNVQALRTWIKQEVAALDWGCVNRSAHATPAG
ncbi:LysR family transcriptional regulator, glycine cleavage system transcriptional activator [Rhizobiales bacterium GAS191]|nr:LysR family transcriptional regulator, glycine cleavage system transcriptional activator [Rhizobiales bacterium GAS191]